MEPIARVPTRRAPAPWYRKRKVQAALATTAACAIAALSDGQLTWAEGVTCAAPILALFGVNIYAALRPPPLK